ncbi:MAG: threonine aldolase [Acidobacteria bacterium CG_4_9_14_3_um_filter_49_7]|nr:MAG: threonine aldolase [Acidobacteria bacterium CG_4_9_14_3_um_filter_49_7]
MDGISFGSDNHSGIHPKVLEMMATANVGHVIAYGEDAYTKQAESLIKEHFGSASTFYPVFNGTGANVLSLKAATRPFHSIICAKTAHINTDECGAPEHFTGCKLESIETDDGKLRPKDVAQKLQGRHDEHHNQPRIVSITQATEVGTTYTPEEVRELADYIHKHDLFLHMDGARIANAAAFLDVPFRDITTDAGVDILSFGGTKNGMMMGESVIVLNRELDSEMKFIRKQGTQLASKMRFLSAQFIAYLKDGLWLSNARHANRMAGLLADLVRDIPGVDIPWPVEANGVFARLPRTLIPELQEQFFFYVWDEEAGIVRWMCSFDTEEKNVRNFADAVRSMCEKHAKEN